MKWIHERRLWNQLWNFGILSERYVYYSYILLNCNDRTTMREGVVGRKVTKLLLEGKSNILGNTVETCSTKNVLIIFVIVYSTGNGTFVPKKLTTIV